MFYTLVVVKVVEYGPTNPALPVVSVTQPECRMTVYLVPFDMSVVGVMFRVLPVMVVVIGFAVPRELFISSIHGLVPK